jgi:hypothetical protein
MASSLQKRAFISEVKSKLLLLIQSGLPLVFLRPASSLRSPGDEWEDGSAAYPIVLDGASARGGYARGRAESEVRDISAKLELSRSVQARLTSGQERFKATIGKLRSLSRRAARGRRSQAALSPHSATQGTADVSLCHRTQVSDSVGSVTAAS